MPLNSFYFFPFPYGTPCLPKPDFGRHDAVALFAGIDHSSKLRTLSTYLHPFHSLLCVS
jgi:hypothetical protein